MRRKADKGSISSGSVSDVIFAGISVPEIKEKKKCPLLPFFLSVQETELTYSRYQVLSFRVELCCGFYNQIEQVYNTGCGTDVFLNKMSTGL